MVSLSKKEWNEVKSHIAKYNEEFGRVEEKISSVEKQQAVHTTDITWIKEKLGMVDTRLWALLTVSILGLLVTIAIKIWFK